MTVTLGLLPPSRSAAGAGPADRVRLAARQRSADLRLRGLAELLVQAHATNDSLLVGAVDDAVGRLRGAGSARFAERLRAVRALFGPVPVAYDDAVARAAGAPRAGTAATADARAAAGARGPAWARRAPGPEVRAAVGALVRWADEALPEPGRIPCADPGVPCDAALAADLIERYGPARPAGLAHRGACRSLAVPLALTWRTWWWHGSGPMLGVPGWTLSAGRSAVMFGLHAGAHLDLQWWSAVERGPSAAVGLEFGAGLIVAESVTMAVEYSASARVPALRPYVRQGLVGRLARLPRLARWGPAAVPDSAIMAAAVEAAEAAEATGDAEFGALPRLAAAYTAGPVLLAWRGFSHRLVPGALRGPLRSHWSQAGLPERRSVRPGTPRTERGNRDVAGWPWPTVRT
jgi:hypothetical protein